MSEMERFAAELILTCLGTFLVGAWMIRRQQTKRARRDADTDARILAVAQAAARDDLERAGDSMVAAFTAAVEAEADLTDEHIAAVLEHWRESER